MNDGNLEIDKLNGQSFLLWKLKIEVLLVDKDQWITMDLSIKPMAMSHEEWKKMDQKENCPILLDISD